MDTFDYIIAGGGSAGCVLANRLSADPRRRVLLLEAGGRDNYIWIKVPVGYLYCIGNPRTDWMMRTAPEEANSPQVIHNFSTAPSRHRCATAPPRRFQRVLDFAVSARTYLYLP